MDINSIMKQATKMQEKMKEIEAQMANAEHEGSAGGGMVKVLISGNQIAKKVQIDPSLIDRNEIEVLEDLLVAAFNDAKKKADEGSGEALKAATAGIQLPPGFKF